MEIEKIEVLVEKIDQAINIIQRLKNENRQFIKEIDNYKKEITKFKTENSKLKEENTHQKDEIKKTNDLHQKLEVKIQQILQYLPDEEDKDENIPVINNKTEEAETINNIEVINDFDDKETALSDENEEEEDFGEENFNEKEKNDEEKDKERLTQLVNEPDKFEKKSLFPSFENDKVNESTENQLENDNDNIDKKTTTKISEEKYEETLINEKDDSDIDFHFDDEQDQNDDLPKGVL